MKTDAKYIELSDMSCGKAGYPALIVVNVVS